MCLDVSRGDASFGTLFSGHRRPVRPVLERRNEGGDRESYKREIDVEDLTPPSKPRWKMQLAKSNARHWSLEANLEMKSFLLEGRG